MTETTHHVSFAFEDQREGVKITPAMIDFALFNFVNRAVAIGTRAWTDLPDIGQWFAVQHRGAA
jgi:hypothetical protein